MYKPLKKKVLIEINQNEEKTKSGIIITSQNPKDGGYLQKGIIVALGEDCGKEEAVLSKVKIGTKCLFNPYNGFEIRDDVGASKYVVCDVSGIYAIE